MENDEMKVPSFMDLMEDWREEFNKTNTRGREMYFHDFPQKYLCIKIKRGPNEAMEDHTCIGHLHTETSPKGNGIEIGVKGEKELEFLRPEDPDFFQKLLIRVDEKLSDD